MTATDPRRQPADFDETQPDPTPATDAAPPTETTPEDAELKKALAEATEMKDAWLRARAEIENVRRQGQADVAKAHKYAIEKFAEDLLPVKDALEQTLAADAAV